MLTSHQEKLVLLTLSDIEAHEIVDIHKKYNQNTWISCAKVQLDI